MDHVALAQTPQAWPLFSLFATVKGRLAFTLGIGGANPVCHWRDSALSGRFMWCGGLLLSPEKAGLALGRWGRCFGSSGPPHQSCRAACFPREGKRRAGGWPLLAEDGVMRNMAPHTLSFTALSVDRVIQRGVPQGSGAGCTTVIFTQPSCVISQSNLTCQRSRGATADNKYEHRAKTTTWCTTTKPSSPPIIGQNLWLFLICAVCTCDFYSNWTTYTGNNNGCH